MNLQGRKVTIMGLGHFGGGVAAARWVARQGALVTVTDLADRENLTDALESLSGEPIDRFHLGGHREDDFRAADVVVVNPAVKPEHPLLKIAAAGARLTSEIELFLDACPAAVVGVTGSNGKSTTAAMIAAIFEADGRRTWLGGNLGGSLLGQLERIRPADWVVLELSSFQLFRLGFDASTRPLRVAVVTNCSPNHLNWHGTYAHYVSSKQRILAGQSAGDLAVLNAACGEVAGWSSQVRGRLLPLVDMADLPALAVPGEHNRQNAVLAATAAQGVGCRRESIRTGLASFRPLPGRLEWIRAIDGRHFYNDTTATTPESTIAGLSALAEPVWLLAGGSDKGADFDPLALAIVRHARGAAFYGAVRHSLCDRAAALASDFPTTMVETMDEALAWCWRRSRPGEAILLSPACASHDQFENFRHRGQRFVALVSALADGCNR
jgi:UDP-N-acetylmuramoylalanine--D-glutamate ligase